MKSLTYAFILLTLTAVTPSVCAQSTGAGGAGKKSPVIAGEAERAGAQIQVVLTNLSDTRAFQGTAKVSAGLSADTAIQLTISLGPNETRRFPLPTASASETSGNQYSLAVYNQAGELVLFKIAPIKTTAGSERETAPKQAPASKKSSAEISVNAQLTRGLANRDAEIPTNDQAEPFLLTFDIESDTPIKNASFILSAKDFQRRQQVTIDGRASIEFKLPETLSERKLSYTLTSSTGQTLASGEVDLDQLATSDSVSVSALTFDRPAYAPGESARAVIELLGDATRGYRLELTVKDGGNFLLKDERRGSTVAGKSRQEFSLEIPREAHGPIILAYRVFGGQTGAIFDSGSREIAIKETREDKSGGPKRLSP
ncbi:MAG TPA: hypothetical protein VFV58_08840 [Blastocatellia bacterium]|jgi:hypothetical protein|nr:hypothetical protein [Blastocatellia bacterium]